MCNGLGKSRGAIIRIKPFDLRLLNRVTNPQKSRTTNAGALISVDGLQSTNKTYAMTEERSKSIRPPWCEQPLLISLTVQ